MDMLINLVKVIVLAHKKIQIWTLFFSDVKVYA